MDFRGVPGHEFVGTVEQCQVESWIGKRVCGEINIGCQNCKYCRKGLQRHCPHRTVLGILGHNGAFAEYLTLPVQNLHLLPDSISDDQGVFVEPVAAALEINEQIQIEPDCHIAVVGDGKLGLLICQTLRLTAADITLFGKHAEKLSVAERLGIKTATMNDVAAHAYDVVVEVSGSESGFNTAMVLLRPRGTLILKSTYHGELKFDAAAVVIDEFTIVGSRCGPFQPAINLLASGLVIVDDLISDVLPFHAALQAFEIARRSESLKVILRYDDQC
jgi:threonine dehydrogenase-like Zn-dependent dehydrogenase